MIAQNWALKDIFNAQMTADLSMKASTFMQCLIHAGYDKEKAKEARDAL